MQDFAVFIPVCQLHHIKVFLHQRAKPQSLKWSKNGDRQLLLS